MKEVNKTEKSDFASAITSVSAIYNHRLDKGAANIYWHILKDYGINNIKKALYSHLKDPENGKFFPKPCDIIQIIDGKPSDKAILAWAKLFKFFSDNTINEKPVIFDDPIIHYCVDVMGGIYKIRSAKLSEEGFKRKEFIDTYNAAMNDKSSYLNNYSNILNVYDIELPFEYKHPLRAYCYMDDLVNEIDKLEKSVPNTFCYNHPDYEELIQEENKINNYLRMLKAIQCLYNKLYDTIFIGNSQNCFNDVFLKGKYKIHDFIIETLTKKINNLVILP